LAFSPVAFRDGDLGIAATAGRRYKGSSEDRVAGYNASKTVRYRVQQLDMFTKEGPRDVSRRAGCLLPRPAEAVDADSQPPRAGRPAMVYVGEASAARRRGNTVSPK